MAGAGARAALLAEEQWWWWCRVARFAGATALLAAVVVRVGDGWVFGLGWRIGRVVACIVAELVQSDVVLCADGVVALRVCGPEPGQLMVRGIGIGRGDCRAERMVR